MVNIMSGTMSFAAIHKLAKEKGVTVTEFFAAILMDIHCRKQLREKRKLKEVSVQIPINLRNIYPSETMRNFSICLRVKVDPKLGEYSFDELLQQVALQLRLERDEKKINAQISKHVRIEKNPFLRFLPLAVKNFCLGNCNPHFRRTDNLCISQQFRSCCFAGRNETFYRKNRSYSRSRYAYRRKMRYIFF